MGRRKKPTISRDEMLIELAGMLKYMPLHRIRKRAWRYTVVQYSLIYDDKFFDYADFWVLRKEAMSSPLQYDALSNAIATRISLKKELTEAILMFICRFLMGAIQRPTGTQGKFAGHNDLINMYYQILIKAALARGYPVHVDRKPGSEADGACGLVAEAIRRAGYEPPAVSTLVTLWKKRPSWLHPVRERQK